MTISENNIIDVDLITAGHIESGIISSQNMNIGGIVNIDSNTSFNIGCQYVTIEQLEAMLQDLLLSRIGIDSQSPTKINILEAEVSRLKQDLTELQTNFQKLTQYLKDERWQEV